MMNEKAMEELIKAYIYGEEMQSLSFGALYALACKRDEEAAAQLKLSCV